jgi:hypothetical protein
MGNAVAQCSSNSGTNSRVPVAGQPPVPACEPQGLVSDTAALTAANCFAYEASGRRRYGAVEVGDGVLGSQQQCNASSSAERCLLVPRRALARPAHAASPKIWHSPHSRGRRSSRVSRS